MNNGEWNWQQDHAFECALFPNQEDDVVDRLERIAAGLPGKTAEEVKAHYDLLVEDINQIESDLVPLPDYVDKDKRSNDSDGGKREQKATRGRRESRKWTPAEHMAFLWGIKEGHSGDWRCISRQYVPTKTPSQVASHAQKYFLRQKKEPSRKKRQSIHDVSLETLVAGTATNNSIIGHPAVQSNRSIAGQLTRQTDRPANGWPTNGIPALNNDMLMNGSPVQQPLQFRHPPAPAYRTPINLRPEQLVSGTFIPLFSSDDPRASSLHVAPMATLALPKQELRRLRDARHCPVSQDSASSFPVRHRSNYPSNA